MEIDLDARLVRLSAGEFSEFTVGPRSADGGPSGLWRAQLGTQWHRTLRDRTAGENPAALFEVPIVGELAHRGWRIALNGRIDQWIPDDAAACDRLREVKTVTCELPLDDAALRADYGSYFHQLGIYLLLLREGDAPRPDGLPPRAIAGELFFLEVATGLAQTVPFTHDDERRCLAQLERLCEFLDASLRARARLRSLAVRPAFSEWRPGQEHTVDDLVTAWRQHPIVCFEAPTGFGKTGVMLEAALRRLRDGEADRLLYLTSKATGQLQVMATLGRMTATADGEPGLSVWRMRPRSEHCINTLFRCSPESCRYLHNAEERWPTSGLSRFYTVPGHARDLPALREAGRAATLCPYEITRAALPFNEVWVGDFNYVFSPAVAPLFSEQPGYNPARTLVLVDEAHNLPSRAADARSFAFSAPDTSAVVSLLQGQRAQGGLVQAWDAWAWSLSRIQKSDTLSAGASDDAADQLQALARRTQELPVDTSSWPPALVDVFWGPSRFAADARGPALPRLWWAPQDGQLLATCLDAAEAIGPLLRGFAGVLLASATLRPVVDFRAACGLVLADAPPATATAAADEPDRPERLGRLSKRATTSLLRKLQTGASLLRESAEQDRLAPAHVRADAPWRRGAFDIAIDLRADTRYQQRDATAPLCAESICALVAAAPAGQPCVPIFFPSFAYAESIARQPAFAAASIRVALQPRAADTEALERWLEIQLGQSVAVFLVLGSSLAEAVDMLGGRAWSAMVVGPALPEVNAVQKAKSAPRPGESRQDTFRRVYQVPGMARVNQALGRLVRAPGQRARVLLHCRRFAEASYHELLDADYQGATQLSSDAEFRGWVG
ncbi:helicase C-terminal domain-containing protein [Nibricoccus sp. IMCC34717]|uniref:helicase C-terminal domain-containing protein n=1 Tax=Nibricoccus sp. IMCC34717 TaxID=3034021 RepID=UPI00384E6B17